jgi:hypothetical protein
MNRFVPVDLKSFRLKSTPARFDITRILFLKAFDEK